MIHVQARLWIDAREEAARIAGCAPENVDCQRDCEYEAQARVEQILEGRKIKQTPRLTAWQSGQSVR